MSFCETIVNDTEEYMELNWQRRKGPYYLNFDGFYGLKPHETLDRMWDLDFDHQVCVTYYTKILDYKNREKRVKAAKCKAVTNPTRSGAKISVSISEIIPVEEICPAPTDKPQLTPKLSDLETPGNAAEHFKSLLDVSAGAAFVLLLMSLRKIRSVWKPPRGMNEPLIQIYSLS
eukprot:gnl/MRDRNA2_/MRDRNA2_79382_c0_seq1.p1 gnl/MRDRNA2_/MRDRNA2_79382_c0~~gnl/MRDRNA2_/MRDRNA2_79382_c0_seq1.p1  ORF type:complete len:174 (-),score=17.48 gnl/MRDRNA2_/MRDRNA2_79382_c0_seq1:101-622(-)